MSSSQNSNQYINAKNTGDEHQRAGPRLAMPIVIRRNGIGKNLQRQCGNGLAEAVVPKAISESGEKKRRCFAAHTSERERGFAVSIWHKKNNFLRRAQDQRNHDQAQCEATSVG